MVKRKGLPEWGELVVCTVKKVSPFAAWVTLNEYPNAEGMIHISEAVGKWIYDIRDYVKPGKQYVAKVIRIDYQKNFLNLSLKRVSEKDEKEKLNEYRKEQRAEKILEQAAKLLGKNLDQAYEEVGFLIQEKFGRLYDFFEKVIASEKFLEKLELSEEWKKALIEAARKSIKKKERKIKAELVLKSFAADGIKRIKLLLAELEEKGLNVSYISAPTYRVEVTTTEPKKAEKNLINIFEKLVEKAKNLGVEASCRQIE
jgi:translation initiation factor 2 subunit 1